MSDLIAAAFLVCALCIGTALAERDVDGLGNGSRFTVEGAQHLPFGFNVGYQVLLPGMRFNCYGNLTSWSALVVYRNSISSMALGQVIFQVWRPTGSGKYKLVGFDEILVQPENLQPIPDTTHKNKNLAYHYVLNENEDRTEDGQMNLDKEENSPLFFQPGDIVGVLIQSFTTTNRQLYITYRNKTESDPDHVVMDMFYNKTGGEQAMCEMNTCSDEIQTVESVVPNIFFTYDEVAEDDPVFNNQDPSSTGDCAIVDPTPEECPSVSSPLSPSPSVSYHMTPSTAPSGTVPSSSPSITGSPQMNENLLTIIAVSAAGAVLILVLGGVFIVVVALACKKKKALGDDNCGPPREAANALYSEMNVVDEPTAYASTYRLKSGIYLEQERNAADPSAPHFSIRTGGSIVSLSSHNGRPQFSISGPVQSGPASIQKILTPGEVGAVSMQLPRGCRIGGGSLGEDQRRSLRVVPSGTHQRPPIPSVMQPHHLESNLRRGSMPLKTLADPHHQLNPGKSMPALSPSSQSPSPFPCPPTPQMCDPPVPYLTPKRPWYKSDYESTTITEKERCALPAEEGLYVPTMEERSRVGEDYSRLRQPHHSKGSNGETAFFDGPDTFNEPASSTNEIYQQLSSWKTREIIRMYIKLQDQIGSGHFATVCRGVWQRPGGEQEVAVKELKSGAQEEDRVKFLQEAAIMSQFNHTNVVQLHGIVTIDEPLLIVMELMPNGDLKNYLDRFTANRRSPRQRHSAGSTPPPSPGSILPITPSLPHQLLSFCRQVADGMEYLSLKRFVHRDLAARNIFLTKDFTCKIGDFGLARDLGREDLYQSRGGKIPVKWTAPEALQYRHFTSASDVWSYGMVLFEIWSLGHRPFDACTIEKDVMELIGERVCQPPPPGCPREIYKLMTLCWDGKASNRPTFSSVCVFLNVSDSKLLRLPAELPSTVSPQATQLGAPLSEAKGLHSDLQYRYEESVV